MTSTYSIAEVHFAEDSKLWVSEPTRFHTFDEALAALERTSATPLSEYAAWVLLNDRGEMLMSAEDLLDTTQH